MSDPIAALLKSYGFELAVGETADETVARWLTEIDPDWVRLAILEALHQGRYKAISVEQILQVWQRRGEPRCHFSSDFERLICQNPPRPQPPATEPQAPTALSPRLPLAEIPSFSPKHDASDLYFKLQATARQQGPEEAEAMDALPDDGDGDRPANSQNDRPEAAD